jgi:hypothetical protein
MLSKIFDTPSTPEGDFARLSSQCYREFKNKKCGSLDASRHFPLFINPPPNHIIICIRISSMFSAKGIIFASLGMGWDRMEEWWDGPIFLIININVDKTVI